MEAFDQTKNTYQKLAVKDNVDESNLRGWGQGIVDDGHEANVNDHQSGYVSDFIVEVRALNKGKEGEDGDEY